MRRPALSAPPTVTAPVGTVERGWLDYAAVLERAASYASTADQVLVLARLAFYGGAAHALGELQVRSSDTWASTIETLALEVLDDADRLVVGGLLARRGL